MLHLRWRVDCRTPTRTLPLEPNRSRRAISGTRSMGTMGRSTCAGATSGAAYGAFRAVSWKRKNRRKVARGFFRRKARETQRSKSEVPLSRFPLVSLGQLQKTPFDFLDDANRLDPYATLQIPVFSGKRQIRKAYAKLCKQHHPDLHRGRESMEWMLIQRAYRILTDSEERVYYDAARMTRNALSATEGFAAFAFSAAQQMGSVLADATEAAASAAVRLAGFGRFLAKESQAWAERGLESLEFQEASAEADELRSKRADTLKRIRQLKQARKDLEAAAALRQAASRKLP
ncbi:unnamed protein product [Durusdinium trenchii]|uniref:J domain-containing protein n=1 Tax=Durusdinium trenchii TaxID=1381693 RepID=A0ABP0H9Q7_9DINO